MEHPYLTRYKVMKNVIPEASSQRMGLFPYYDIQESSHLKIHEKTLKRIRYSEKTTSTPKMTNHERFMY